MNDLPQKIMEGLETKTKFTIPILGGIPIPDSVFVTWLIMAVLILFSLIFVRNLKLKPKGGIQIYLEMGIGTLNNFLKGIMGNHAKVFLPYLGTIIVYLFLANAIGIFGLTPPTKDLNVTAAMAIMSAALIIIANIRYHGVGGWIKSYAKPVAVVTPINLMEIVIRPLSLCMRLFGNVLGAFVIMELIKAVIPVGVPVVFSFYFDLFDGAIQAFVFVFLTSLFVGEAVEG